MATRDSIRTARVEARMAPNALAGVRRAAELQGAAAVTPSQSLRLKTRTRRSRTPKSIDFLLTISGASQSRF